MDAHANHDHCPQCKIGKRAFLILLDRISSMPHLRVIDAMLRSGVDEISRDAELVPALSVFIHFMGVCTEDLAQRASLYALHQVVRIEDGTEAGPVVPMLCLACCLPAINPAMDQLAEIMGQSLPHSCKRGASLAS